MRKGQGILRCRIAATGLVLLAMACSVFADISLRFDIQPRVISVGESAVCTITVRGVDSPPTPTLPDIAGFQVNMAGTERSMSFGNGGADSSTTFRYRLIPLQAGTFTIGPYTYAFGQQTANLPAITLEVVDPGSTKPGETETPQNPSDFLFAVLDASLTNLYSQQTFDILLAVYSRGLNLGADVGMMNLPVSGLEVQPLQELQGGREVINNEVYDVRRFRARTKALTAGTFNLTPNVRLAIKVPRDRRRRDPFFGSFNDSFIGDFFGRYEMQPVDIQPRPVSIVVTPLPEKDRPAGFSGAVGRFQFAADAKPTELSAGDPITLSMQIAGEGNVENVSAPDIQFGNDFKTYETKLVSKDVNAGNSTGRKVFEQVIIPRSAEVKNVPEITFSYFDPSDGQYHTIRQGPFPLEVKTAANQGARLVQGGDAQPDHRAVLLGTDIVYLKPAPHDWYRRNQRQWYANNYFLGLQALPPITFAILAFVMRRRNILASDIALARRHKAPKTARRELQKAEAAGTGGRRAAFFEHLAQALSDYFGNRLNLAPGEVSSDVVLRNFSEHGLDAGTQDALRQLFNRCEQERFGSIDGSTLPQEEANALLTTSRQALRECERVRL